MALNLPDLESVREFMVSEVERDIGAGSLYLGDRLSSRGRAEYPDLLREAVASHDDSWLASRIVGRLNTFEDYTLRGQTRRRRVRSDAAAVLAEGEFNRFYIRAVCVRAIRLQVSEVLVFRAKAVRDPRPESQARVGTRVNAAALLADLRQNIGVETALGIPAGPNSGLSVKFP